VAAMRLRRNLIILFLLADLSEHRDEAKPDALSAVRPNAVIRPPNTTARLISGIRVTPLQAQVAR
jgi:hypothetical protein